MNFLLTLIIFGFCFAALAIGLLIKQKILKRGCGISPDDCACLKEGKDPIKCDNNTAEKERS